MRKHSYYLLCTAMVFLMIVGCSNNKQLPDEPVRPTITFQEQNIEYLEGPYCWFGTNTEEGVCGVPPHPTTFNKSIKEKALVADSGGAIRIKFPIKPDNFTLTVVNVDGGEESIGKQDQYSYKLSLKPGYYRYILSAVWEERNTASYYFGIQIIV